MRIKRKTLGLLFQKLDHWTTPFVVKIHNAIGYDMVEIFQSRFTRKIWTIWANDFGELLFKSLSFIVQSLKISFS